MQQIMTQITVSAHDLTYRYGDRLAVDHISFEVQAGEVLGFLGPNGAGKSTTIRMLTGQLRPIEGRAIILGKDISAHTKAVQAQIGVAFESANLYEQMTATENLTLFAQLFGVRHFDARALLERVGLAGRENERVSGYSKGMKQRLMLARAIVNSPRVLFLDEPTDGLDPVSSQTIHTLIREMAAGGTTVFLTTHDMTEADKLSDRVAFITGGRIAALDTPTALKQRYGRRALRAQVVGDPTPREIPLDQPDTPERVRALFAKETIVTVHSEEASLEDIFFVVTGKGLRAS